jgi:hypothetical protein
MDLKGVVVVKHYKADSWITGTISDIDDGIEVTWCYGKIEKFQADTEELLVYDIGPTGM